MVGGCLHALQGNTTAVLVWQALHAAVVSASGPTLCSFPTDGSMEAPNRGGLHTLFSMVLGGLVGATPHMISATVMALARLLYEFAPVLAGLVPDLLPAVLMLLRTKAREVIKSVLGFIKVGRLPTCRSDIWHAPCSRCAIPTTWQQHRCRAHSTSVACNIWQPSPGLPNDLDPATSRRCRSYRCACRSTTLPGFCRKSWRAASCGQRTRRTSSGPRCGWVVCPHPPASAELCGASSAAKGGVHRAVVDRGRDFPVLQVRWIVEKLAKRCGFEAVARHMPEAHAKLLSHIRKENSRRDRRHSEAGSQVLQRTGAGTVLLRCKQGAELVAAAAKAMLACPTRAWTCRLQMDVDEAEETRTRKSCAETTTRTARRSEWNEDVFSGALLGSRCITCALRLDPLFRYSNCTPGTACRPLVAVHPPSGLLQTQRARESTPFALHALK